MQTAYPSSFDQPCICDVCGQDVEGEPGCTCPETTLEQQIQKVLVYACAKCKKETHVRAKA